MALSLRSARKTGGLLIGRDGTHCISNTVKPPMDGEAWVLCVRVMYQRPASRKASWAVQFVGPETVSSWCKQKLLTGVVSNFQLVLCATMVPLSIDSRAACFGIPSAPPTDNTSSK